LEILAERQVAGAYRAVLISVPFPAQKIFVYMCHGINKKKLLCFSKNRSIVLQRAVSDHHENQRYIPGMNLGPQTTLQTENLTRNPSSQPA
jgi:hypothetical protein